MKMRNQRPPDRECLARAIRREGSASDRRKFRELGGSVLAQRRSATMLRGAPCRQAEHRVVTDWLIGITSLAAILLAVAIGITATIALGKNPAKPDSVLTNTVSTPGDADGYVEGLARLGIVKISCFPRAPRSGQSPKCSHDRR
jgi:hypothetical protein